MDISPEAWAFLGVLAVQGSTLGGIAIRYGRRAGRTPADAPDTEAIKGAVREVVAEELKDVREDVKEVRRDLKTHLRDHAVTFGHHVPLQRASG